VLRATAADGRTSELAVLHRISAAPPRGVVPASTAVRVVIADGQALVRASFRVLLEGDQRVRVVGEAATGEEAVALAHRTLPDVALVDAGLPGLDSVEATRRMASEGGVAVMLLTASEGDRRIFDALRAGAGGCYSRTASRPIW
jgi:DNA-binding NarL/FixJ family response regulator